MPPPLFLLLPQTWVMPTASTVVKTLTKNKYLKLPNFKKPEPTFERCDWKLSLPCFIFTTLLLDPSVWQKVVETLKRLQDIYFLQLDHFLTFLCDFSKKCICFPWCMVIQGLSNTELHKSTAARPELPTFSREGKRYCKHCHSEIVENFGLLEFLIQSWLAKGRRDCA